MSPTQQLRLILIAFLGGVILSLSISLFYSVLCLVIILGLSLTNLNLKNLLLLPLVFGLCYANFYSFYFYPNQLNQMVGQSVSLKAEVVGETRVSRSGQQTVRLKIDAWRQNSSEWQEIKGSILWQNAPKPLFNTGDKIEVKGVITNVSNFSEDFNAQVYWSRWGVSQSLIRSELISRPISGPNQNFVWRDMATNRLENLLQKPHLTVALGMLVGLKEKLPKALENDFKASGLQHLLVVSGTNVTLLIVAIGLCLKPLGPWYKYGIGLLALMAYLYLVGFDPPALRATLFGVLTGFAITSGFNIEYRNLFLLVASILVLIDPRFLTHDVSFWLSFSATSGILFGMPMVYKVLCFVKYKYLRLLLGASFCAQMAVFPILIIQFGSFPYAGLISNLITEPLVPLIMFLAAGGILIGDFEMLGIAYLWQASLEGSISALILVAQLFGLLMPVYVPPSVGYFGALCLLAIALWASFSAYYQRHFWQCLEVEMKGGE